MRTHQYISGRVHHKVSGAGMGTLLLNKGGSGSASSYASIDDYKHAIGEGLGNKLDRLMVKPLETLRKKTKNIRF